MNPKKRLRKSFPLFLKSTRTHFGFIYKLMEIYEHFTCFRNQYGNTTRSVLSCGRIFCHTQYCFQYNWAESSLETGEGKKLSSPVVLVRYSLELWFMLNLYGFDIYIYISISLDKSACIFISYHFFLVTLLLYGCICVLHVLYKSPPLGCLIVQTNNSTHLPKYPSPDISSPLVRDNVMLHCTPGM